MPPSSARFRSGRRALTAIGCAVAIYGVLLAGFGSLAAWAEIHADAYPYELGEEMFRILLPTVAGQPGEGRIMLIGSSTAQEALLYEEFEDAFPDRDAFQVSYSMATLNDVTVALEYVESVHGEDAMPDVVVAALETRSMANLPRTFGEHRGVLVGEREWELDEQGAESFLFEAIREYSPHFSVEPRPGGSILVAKDPIDGLVHRLRFATQKQQPRYRAALIAALNRLVNGPGPQLELAADLPELENVRSPLIPDTTGEFVRFVLADPVAALRGWLAASNAPYIHRYRPAFEYQEDPGGEAGIGFWEPDLDAALVTTQLERMKALTDRHGIQLVVLLLPEHPVARAEMLPERDAALLAIARGALGDALLLDLRAGFDEDDFVDNNHLYVPGARRVTAEAIRAIESGDPRP